LASAYARLTDASRCIGEAMSMMETSKEKWCEPKITRIAGEIALKSPAPDADKAQAYFERVRSWPSTAGEVLGTARGDKPGAALA